MMIVHLTTYDPVINGSLNPSVEYIADKIYLFY
jgi:hypothetical protein